MYPRARWMCRLAGNAFVRPLDALPDCRCYSALGVDRGQGFPHSQSQLVNAGSSLDAALDSFQAVFDFIYGQAFTESGYALGVAVASADKMNVCHDISLQIEINLLGTGSLGLI